MGFTNVAWESRDTEQLARDLTDGPGPMPIGNAAAAWVRIANEIASVSSEYQLVVQRLGSAVTSESATQAARKMEDFGRWLQALALNAAANGERSEAAAVATGSAVMAMPSVPEAVEVRAERDVMNSLAAYNGAIIDGHFADVDEAAIAGHVQAADVMYRYEESCAALAAPWDQPVPPDDANGAALQAERAASARGVDHEGNGVGAPDGARGGAVVEPVMPLAPLRAPDVKSTADPRSVQAAGASTAASGTVGMGGMGTGYGPMAAVARGDDGRHHESSLIAKTLEGGGEPIAGISDAAKAWLPTAQAKEAPMWVADVSWSDDVSMFDSPTTPDQSISSRDSEQWMSPSAMGVDRELRR